MCPYQKLVPNYVSKSRLILIFSANVALTENMKLCITVITAVDTVGEYECAVELVSQITQQFHDSW